MCYRFSHFCTSCRREFIDHIKPCKPFSAPEMDHLRFQHSAMPTYHYTAKNDPTGQHRARYPNGRPWFIGPLPEDKHPLGRCAICRRDKSVPKSLPVPVGRDVLQEVVLDASEGHGRRLKVKEYSVVAGQQRVAQMQEKNGRMEAEGLARELDYVRRWNARNEELERERGKAFGELKVADEESGRKQ